jgi:hypothetical protein
MSMRRILSILAVGLATVQTLTMLSGSAYAAALPSAASPPSVYKAKAASIKVKVDPIPNVKRGQFNVPVRVTVPTAGLVCKLSIKYYGNDGEDSPDNVTADANGICTFIFNVPKDKDAVGDAQAKVKIVDSKGKQQGEFKVNFDVRN